MKTKITLCLVMFMSFTMPASAFIFTDPASIAQRAAQFIQRSKEWIDTTTHYRQMVEYAQTFNQYRNMFDTYMRTYNRVYSRVSSGQYHNAFDVTKWDWTRLDDHILRTWKSYNRAFWDAQQIALMTNQLIQNNPAYRQYATRLSNSMNDAQEKLKENEAMLKEIRDQNKNSVETLNKLKIQNEALTVAVGTSPDQTIDVAQLQSLNNLILLEQIKILEQESMIKSFEREQQEEYKKYINELNDMQRELKTTAGDEGTRFILNFMEKGE